VKNEPGVKRKRYTRKFQRMAVARMMTSPNIGELASELGVTRECLYKWRRKLDQIESSEESARPATHEAFYRKQVQQLKRMLAEKSMEVDFFKGALQKVEARRQRSNGSGERASTTRSGK
jgi:transposase